MRLFEKPKAYRFTSTQAFIFVLCLIASSLYLGVSLTAVTIIGAYPFPEYFSFLYRSRFSTMIYVSFLDLAVSLGFLMEYLIQTKKASRA